MAKQDWSEGATVKVGFLSLVVVRKTPPAGAFAPDGFVLRNAAGTQHYTFTPHGGLQKLSETAAHEMIEGADCYIGLLARQALEAAANRPAWFR